MITAIEKAQSEIIRELIAERKTLRDENKALQEANAELDADLNAALQKIVERDARLKLEKAGYRCSCGEGS